MKGGLAYRITDRFERDYRGLQVDLQRAVDECIFDLESDPIPSSRRPHSVTPRGTRPNVLTVDVTANKSHKLSFHIEGRVAVLRRVGTHKQIDRGA